MIRFVPLAVLLMLVGCSAPDEGGAGVEAGAGGGVPVEVTLTSYEIEVGDSVPAGEVVFELTNDSDHDHGFAITGDGVDRTLVEQVEPGSTSEASIELEPGTYTVWCPIGDHRDRGMEAELTVTEGSDGAPS
jgi:uncharacterized cupredoxin-like copper-binding protein